jgi:hydrogenase maturation protease
VETGTGVEFLDDYQLQIEHALDLVGRARVLFVDASLNCRAPFESKRVQAAPDAGLGTHALSPSALLNVFLKLQGEAAPPSTLLAIRGERFELGEPLSEAARSNLLQALAWCRGWLRSS